MLTSPTITELAAALAQFQAQVYAVGKESQGHGYKYASHGKVTETCYPVMAKLGLSVCQMLGQLDGKPCLHTRIMHASGEWMQSDYPLEPVGLKAANNAQQYGAAITYARRYALLAALGVAADDDDAACLTKSPEQEAREAQQTALKEELRKLGGLLRDIDPARANEIRTQHARDLGAMLAAIKAALDEIDNEHDNAMRNEGEGEA